MTQLRITVTNTSEIGGTFLTPVYFGFHDGSFDLFDRGEAVSPGLEQLAEDGAATILADERRAADADSQGIVVTGAGGPVATQETTSALIDVDGLSNGTVAYGAMIIPSNDAFIGTAEGVQLFSDSGRFLGAHLSTITGAQVYDAGTEVNTEMDAAFINQEGPNTGEDENGVVTLHPGFNGSLGNPGGDQIILGGTNAAGAFIDPVAADFTRPGAQIAEIHINLAVETTLDAGGDRFFGARADDLVTGGTGNDLVFGGAGWDVLDGGDGEDRLFGGAGKDALSGGADRDVLHGGGGDDTLSGGTGDDLLIGAGGNDTFVFGTGDGIDTVFDFRAGDVVTLAVEGISSFADLEAVASDEGRLLSFDLGGGDELRFFGTDLADLSEGDFLFA
ncbi:MAG: spondin domain-containing protein [Pseudomonadota bacterium]